MADKLLTWQQKLEAGQPLTALEEVKADADFNYRQRLREQEARVEFESRKNEARSGHEARPTTTSDAKPLNKMTKTELLAVVEDEGVEVDQGSTNTQLVEAIEAHRENE